VARMGKWVYTKFWTENLNENVLEEAALVGRERLAGK
jgi:hypothetical protein